MNASRQRTRLSPQARKQQLLETAKGMIVEDGLQRFTMESLARTANVSSPLVYNYFASRTELLQELLNMEYSSYVTRLNQEVADAASFEDIVRVFITSNFDHYAPGNILPILDSQPEIAATIANNSAEHGRQVARFLVKRAASNFKLSRTQAELVVQMSSGASIAAAQYASYGKMKRDKAIDTALAYVMAGLQHISQQDG